MKPIHIGLLIAAGVLAGVVGTRLMQPSPAPLAQTAPAAAQQAIPDPAQPPAAAEPAEPARPAEPAASPFPEKPKVAARHQAIRPRHRSEAEMAQNQPPAAPAPAASAPAPVPAAAPTPAPEPAPAATPAHNEPALPPPPPPEPHKVTIPVGTMLSVRLVEGLSSERNHAGDTFSATLTDALIVDGFVIADKGSRVQGKIVDVKESGRVSGLAGIGIGLTSLRTSDGQNVAIATDTFSKEAPKTVKQDVERGAAATGIGAVIGAIAGGGKGAAIGAGVGAAAGVGGAVATRGKPATLATETRLQFRLSDPVTITEKLH